MGKVKANRNKMVVKEPVLGVRNTSDVWAPNEGGVGKCGHWDAEYDTYGYCRDEACKKDRLSKALANGKAFRLTDGTVFWMHD